LSVPDVSGYGWAWLQVRAWEARLGGTYEEVVALDRGGYGESPLFYAQGGDPFLALPGLPGPLIGLQSFSLRPAPEPAATFVIVLGLACFFVCRARRRSTTAHAQVNGK
jgi:hypothetical protein